MSPVQGEADGRIYHLAGRTSPVQGDEELARAKQGRRRQEARHWGQSEEGGVRSGDKNWPDGWPGK